MEQSTAKKLEGVWKTLTLIGAIAAAGFAASTYLAGYQRTDDAKAEHVAIRAAQADSETHIQEQIRTGAEERQSIRYINVRIEVSQRQINDRLELIAEQNRTVRTRSARAARADRVEVLEDRIQTRDRALRQSYQDRPPVPDEDAVASGDPLSALDGL